MLHKFREHIISNKTKILILGTFHPDINNGTDFFYGRPRNFLWRILPACFDYEDLKNATLQEKQIFMSHFHIDFADIIHSLDNLPVGQEDNYRDDYIDNYIDEWKNIIEIIRNLPDLNAVYFTRKTFSNIPNIEVKIAQIRNYCVQNCIRFCLLETPARFSNQDKINSWKATIIHKTTCL
ncbi:MAG: hypothetical protein ACK4NY_14420 [Spirosomataceae bacterium]